MSDDVNPEDITAMREQGDLKAFMRSLIRRPGAKPPPSRPSPRPPGHRPGAWPAGTRPVDRGDPHAAWTAEWDAALADYRRLLREELNHQEDQ